MDISNGRTEGQRSAEVGLGEFVVLALAERLINERKTLFTNNFFARCPLPRILLTKITCLVVKLEGSENIFRKMS